MYVMESDNFLPHVDIDSTLNGSITVLILKEGKLKTENYERLLHWRFGHTHSKATFSKGVRDPVPNWCLELISLRVTLPAEAGTNSRVKISCNQLL